MKIEKLGCCLAKPMNAIRDLAAKVNEVIAAHNDHLENHPSGGGGGGESAGGGLVLIHMYTDFDPDAFTFSNNTSAIGYEEALAIYNADGVPWCRLHMRIEGVEMMAADAAFVGIDPQGLIFAPFGILQEAGISIELTTDNTVWIGAD